MALLDVGLLTYFKVVLCLKNEYHGNDRLYTTLAVHYVLSSITVRIVRYPS
jgi:hypothetical protein